MAKLLDKMGGREVVDTAVELFYEKIMADSSIAHFFDSVNMKRQIIKQKAFLFYAFGGDMPYTGSDLRDAHKHLDIKDKDFQAVAGHLNATLQELKVPQEAIDEVEVIVNSVYKDILNI